MKTFFSFLCAFCIAMWQWSCTAESNVDILEIEFANLSFEEVGTRIGPEIMAVLIFSFIDGNGKIGASEGNNSKSQIHYVWEIESPDGAYEPLTFEYEHEDGSKEDIIFGDSNPVPHGEIMNKTANNKTLRGTIKIPLMLPLFLHDNIENMRIAFYISDRDGKNSIPKGEVRKDDDVPQFEYTRIFHVNELQY